MELLLSDNIPPIRSVIFSAKPLRSTVSQNSVFANGHQLRAARGPGQQIPMVQAILLRTVAEKTTLGLRLMYLHGKIVTYLDLFHSSLGYTIHSMFCGMIANCHGIRLQCAIRPVLPLHCPFRTDAKLRRHSDYT